MIFDKNGFNKNKRKDLKNRIHFANKKNSDKKVKLIAIAIITVILVLFGISKNCIENAITTQDTKRPNYNEMARELDLQISAQNKKFNTSISIEPRVYTAQEIAAIFTEISKTLEDRILGENHSIDNITSDVVLCSSINEYPVTIQWLSDNYDVIDENGVVHNMLLKKDECVEVVLTAILQYESYSAEYSYELTVKACEFNEKNYQKKINETLALAQNNDREGEYIRLPEEMDGIPITYEKKADWDSIVLLFLLGMAAMTAVILGEKNNQKKQMDIRNKVLKNTYSEMVAKITLLIGAGMTVRKAWEKIVEEYQFKKIHKNIKPKVVYEEMIESMNQLKSGVSEVRVYEDFGRRCDIREYMKFSSLLVQNLKKGSRELLSMLEIETQDAFEERKNQARRYGEEAGTKLLIPMVMILLVVMVIIMYPALTNFTM